VERLARAVLSVRPLVDVLKSPVRIVPAMDDASIQPLLAENVPSGNVGLAKLLETVATRAGAPHLRLHTTAADLSAIEQVVSNHLRIGAYHEIASQMPISSLSETNETVDEVLGKSFERRYNCSRVESSDGAPLRVYSSGQPSDKAIIIVSACGMPAKLCDCWMGFLGKDHFVITWESRGLFEEPSDFDALNCDVATQAEDLFAVMDHFGVKTAHLLGLCGGAVIAIQAASAQPARVSSMSLWHGDFAGGDSLKTTHQRNLQALITIAAAGRAQAASVHKLFQQSDLINLRPDLAHLILYPYATAEMLFRYGKLNGSIMNTDISNLLERISHPTLVVTSEDDSTAHPEGSMRVAKRIPNAILHVEQHGDHLSLFDAQPHITALAARFISNETLS
jgi:pimeloyl-ACP methyl ester carboxylesterase